MNLQIDTAEVLAFRIAPGGALGSFGWESRIRAWGFRALKLYGIRVQGIHSRPTRNPKPQKLKLFGVSASRWVSLAIFRETRPAIVLSPLFSAASHAVDTHKEMFNLVKSHTLLANGPSSELVWHGRRPHCNKWAAGA